MVPAGSPAGLPAAGLAVRAGLLAARDFRLPRRTGRSEDVICQWKVMARESEYHPPPFAKRKKLFSFAMGETVLGIPTR